ncbi:MAG: 3-oxoadipate enol-lactonase [Proteobacteria bacterium]|nr:3-oxoadipate enol-lactonase [Pseudomonadota bacterium]HQR04162.1 3-oxoadipate enol-lactonase [Rhodocyclaceae bacterium]
MQTVHANQLDFRVDIQGRGPWLTLSHSLACNLEMWEPQMAALTPYFTVLRYDSRGHGGSGVSAGPYDFGLMARDVVALWDALGIGESHFCGLSMGGMIGQHLALDHGSRLDRLILCSTSAGYGEGAPALARLWEQRIAQVRAGGMATVVEATLDRWFTEPFRYSAEDEMARIAAQIRATPVEGYAACGCMIPTLDTLPRLGGIGAPTLVLVGEEDGGTPPAMARVIAEKIRGARLEMLPGCSHLLNIEQAELFNALLLAFLRAGMNQA